LCRFSPETIPTRNSRRQLNTIVTQRQFERPYSFTRPSQRNLIKIHIDANGSSISRPAGICVTPSIYIINANSIAKAHALEQLTADLLAYDISIAIVTETKLKAKHRSEIFAINGFQLFRRDRPERGGG